MLNERHDLQKQPDDRQKGAAANSHNAYDQTNLMKVHYNYKITNILHDIISMHWVINPVTSLEFRYGLLTQSNNKVYFLRKARFET